MIDVVVVGGSLAGLATALAVAQNGQRVLVLERGYPLQDGPVGPRAAAWTGGTVAQRAHSHTLTSCGVATLRTRAPHVLDLACAAGAVLIDLTAAMPPSQAGRVPGDEDLVALGCRRAVVELALRHAVADLATTRTRYGVSVGGVMLDRRRGRVTGVVTGGGEEIHAGLVVDATGSRAQARRWLAAVGVDVGQDETSPTELRVYSRHYRHRGPAGPLNRGNAAGFIGDHYGAVLHPTGRDTFSVAVGVLPEDHALAVLRRPDVLTRVLRATPGIDAWFRIAEPVAESSVRAITCPPNALRAAAVGPRPVPGLIPVGDAACVTDPLYGRGMSLALTHAFALADLVTRHCAPDPAQAHAARRLARELFLPWYRQAVVDGADRIAHWRAALHPGRPAPAERAGTLRALGRAAAHDAVLWRGVMRVLMGLRELAEVCADDQFARRLAATAVPDHPAMGPTRADLLAAISID